MRGAGPAGLSGLRRRSHGRPARAQRQDLGHAAQLEGRPDRATRSETARRKHRVAQRHSTLSTSYALAPPGVTTSTEAPFFLPTNARASGEVMEILPFLASASGSPTICHTVFLSVSSSIKVTVAPNLTVSPDSFDTSITSARASLSSSSAMRPSLIDCDSLAA